MDRFTEVRQNPEMPSRDIDGQLYVLDSQRGVLHSFNPVGSFIWSLLREKRTIEDVVRAIAGEYDVNAQTAERDVLSFLTELRSKDLILVGGD